MANIDHAFHDIAGEHPQIRSITPRDLTDSLRQGWEDFKAQPSHLVFIALIYPVAGILLAQLTVSYNIFPLLFPMLSGFALIGPFAAIGLYEVSRRREQGLDSSWRHALGLLRSPSIGQIVLLGAMLTGLFLAWLFSAWFIYRSLLALPADVSTTDFLRAVFTTFDGWVMIVIGNSLGLLFAILAFSISVVSFPLIIDRHVDAPTAIRTSIAAVEANPRVMMYWGLMVTGLLVLGCLPVLVGLIVVMPVLGHATWHLYRRVVV
ncbi:DUF2189 domain-containing protein [Bosea sp. BH3]|uniref:DUF2189 domain-containing protein n=1 Tax=Bosea sp. BH3 TaxID=2871701 RepID=UPI0021CB3B84|nr:DUF2189 domain-containing protein [Bosea sp. BH3]MCU4180741.1 DUF2189 domain-containing protein [Bosea sp. BH3]